MTTYFPYYPANRSWGKKCSTYKLAVAEIRKTRKIGFVICDTTLNPKTNTKKNAQSRI